MHLLKRKILYITTMYTKVLSTILIKYATGAHFNPKVFEVSIYVPIKVCDCNKCSFKYLYNFQKILAQYHYLF